jgi:hypothetical protein
MSKLAATHLAVVICRLPYERSHNSDNLKLLNEYADKLASGISPPVCPISFWVKQDLQLELIKANLDGSFATLYVAMGLISESEAAELRSESLSGAAAAGTNLLQWLDETVQDAVATADEHEARKRLVRELKAAVEYRSGLGAVRVDNTYASTTVDLARQLECLRVFEAHLLDTDDANIYRGLTFQLYHPWSAPSQTYQWSDGASGGQRMASALMNAHVAADGCMHVIADRTTIQSQLESIDLGHAKVLASVNDFWGRRQRDLTPQLRRVLGVQNVWCDNRNTESQEDFVLWAGRMLNAREDFEAALDGRSFSFSVLVHSDDASPLIDYMPSSSVLQVRAA